MSRTKKKYIYMCVDKYNEDLPIAVADTAGELAKMVGVTDKCITSAIYEREKHSRNSSYIRVEVNDD